MLTYHKFLNSISKYIDICFRTYSCHHGAHGKKLIYRLEKILSEMAICLVPSVMSPACSDYSAGIYKSEIMVSYPRHGSRKVKTWQTNLNWTLLVETTYLFNHAITASIWKYSHQCSQTLKNFLFFLLSKHFLNF